MKFDFDAAIFDMDGTLLDTQPYWRYTMLEFILKHGYPIRSDYLVRMYGEPASKLIPLYAEEEGLDLDMHEVIQELQAFMNRHYIDDVRARPFVKELLEELRKNGIRMCIATATPSVYARNGIERVGISDYFEFLTDFDEVGCTKSSPQFFVELADRLGVKPERCMVFEDALYSIKSAKAAGMRVCAIEEGTQGSDKDEIMAASDIYVRGFDELLG